LEADDAYQEMARARSSYTKLRKKFVHAEKRIMKAAEANGDFSDAKYYRGVSDPIAKPTCADGSVWNPRTRCADGRRRRLRNLALAC